MFGKKVVLLEKHYVVGGLNSFYARQGKKFDVGLHALTNYPSPISGKKSDGRIFVPTGTCFLLKKVPATY